MKKLRVLTEYQLREWIEYLKKIHEKKDGDGE